MEKNFEHISHIKSNSTREIQEQEFFGLTPTADVSDEQESSPVKLNIAKQPESSQLVEGEIAINYKKGHERIFIANDEDEIVGFVNENDLFETQEIVTNSIGQLRDETTSELIHLNEAVDILTEKVDNVASYTNGDGLDLNNNVFSVLIDQESEDVLTVSQNGLKISGIDTKIEEKVQEQIAGLDIPTTQDIETQITTAIEGLDVSDSAVAGQYVSAVSETDGEISVSRANVADAVLTGYSQGSNDAAVAATDTIGEAIGKLENQIITANNNAKSYKIAQVQNPTSATSYSEYVLQVDTGGSGTYTDETNSAVIRIPKDNALLAAGLSTMDATWDSTNSTIVDGTGEEALVLVYQNNVGSVELIPINVADFLRESEFGDGLAVSNAGVVSVSVGEGLDIVRGTNETAVVGKVDTSSESFLSVSNAGFKVSGVQTAIGTETTRAQTAEGELATLMGVTGNEGSRAFTPTTNYGDNSASVSANLQALDTQVKRNANNIRDIMAVSKTFDKEFTIDTTNNNLVSINTTKGITIDDGPAIGKKYLQIDIDSTSSDAESFLSVGTNGLKISGIQDAIDNTLAPFKTNTEDTIEEIEKVVSSSLNDLNDKIKEQNDIISIMRAQIANLEARITALENS